MKSRPSLDLRLSGAGWAELAIKSDAGERLISGISYLSNALDDLLRMGLSIATGRHFATASFYHEPGSTLLIAETAWWDNAVWRQGARLSGIEGEDYSEPEPSWRRWHDSPRMFEVDFGTRDALASAFLNLADGIESRHGHDGYASKWGGDLAFPVRAQAALRCALQIEALPANKWTGE